jgi:hypothetical protein
MLDARGNVLKATQLSIIACICLAHAVDAFNTGFMTTPINLRSSSIAVTLRMSSKSGFGKSQPERKVSKLAEDRAAAATRYENIKSSGSPEFSVFFRVKGATDDEGMLKGGWYPVGSITCPSSQLVSKAIFNTEDALLQGAYRVHAKQIRSQMKTRDGKTLGKWQDMKECDLEYGFQLKEFADEDIKVAERPKEKSELEKTFGNFFQKVQDAVNWVPEK